MRIWFALSPISLALFSCSQVKVQTSCGDKVDSMYSKYGKHLILYCFYDQKLKTRTGADTIFKSYLPFYREEAGIRNILEKDKQVVLNLKRIICDSNIVTSESIERWSRISQQLEKVRSEKEFTLDGYMAFLNTLELTSQLFYRYLQAGRTVNSLSTDEMENIYFTSISLIAEKTLEERELFFNYLSDGIFDPLLW